MKSLHTTPAAAGETKSQALSALGELSKVLRALTPNASLTLSGGKVTEVTLRPTANERQSDAAGLTKAVLGNAAVRVAVTVKQSKADGGVTASGASLLLDGSLNAFILDLGGTAEVRDGGTPGFLKLEGSTVTLNPGASPGSSSKLLVQLSNGSYRMMTFTKTKEGGYRLTYTLSD